MVNIGEYTAAMKCELTPKPLASMAVFTPVQPYANSSAITQPVMMLMSRPPTDSGM